MSTRKTNNDLRFGMFLPPMGWDDTLERWKQIEDYEFDCAGVTDHFMPTTGQGTELDQPFPEAWTLLTALALHSTRLRLAVLVAGNTYRHPPLLAKQAATLDHISGGRLELGIGAGWYQEEHETYGWELPSPGTRVDMLEEALQIIDSLFSNYRTTFNGKHYQLNEAPFEPKPLQNHLPIMIGGRQRRMMGLVAKYADIWSLDNNPDEMRQSTKYLEEHCERIGRDPAEIRRSGFVVTRRVGKDVWESMDTFMEVVEDYLDAGADEIYFRFPPDDKRHMLDDAAKRLADLRRA